MATSPSAFALRFCNFSFAGGGPWSLDAIMGKEI